MKQQALFSLKDKSKKLNCCLLQFLFGALRVKKDLEDNCSSSTFIISLDFRNIDIPTAYGINKGLLDHT